MRQDAKAEYVRESQRTARRLGLPVHGPNADAAIVEYCRNQVADLTAGLGLPGSLGELLDQVSVCLGVRFEEIHSQDDFTSLLRRVPPEIEPALLQVAAELEEDVDGITVRRLAPEPWELPYLAIINCQGKHFHRRFFTKWHELAHRLVDGEQLAMAFRVTEVERKDPGEVLVDKIAAELAFYPEIFAPRAQSFIRSAGLTFESVDALRNSLAPDASRHATALAVMKYQSRPSWYLRCKLSLKLTEQRRLANGMDGTSYTRRLRVVDVSPNDAAIRSGVRVHQWMRVPTSSLVMQAHQSGFDRRGFERLEEWETSDGGSIGFGSVLIDAQVIDDEVFVLVSTADD